MKHFLVVTVVLVLMAFFVVPGAAQESRLKFPNEPGPYAVGFKSVNLYDYTRTSYNGYDNNGNAVTENARPIQTSIWYPANVEQAKGAPRMAFKEYLDQMIFEEGFPPESDALKMQVIKEYFFFWQVPETGQSEMGTVSGAVRDAVAAKGSFPLVVYAPSLQSVSFENSVLCEYLAGHGYIVAASPSIGRFSGAMAIDLMSAEMQARDIEFLIGFMQDFPNVERNRVSVMGFSMGGMSNVLTAMRDSRVDALVCLDGSIRYHYDVLKKSIFHDPDSLTMPALFMTSKDMAEPKEKKGGQTMSNGFEFYKALKYSDASLVRFHQLTHGCFCSSMIRLFDRNPELKENTQEEVNNSYSLMCHHVLKFLDGYIKEDAEALAYILADAKKAGISEDLICKEFKTGKTPPPSMGEFLSKVKAAGYGNLPRIYEKVRKEHPGFTLKSEDFVYIGGKLVLEGKLDMGLAVFNFVIGLDPKQYYAYYFIAEVSLQKGDKEKALAFYEKVLKILEGKDYLGVQAKIDALKKK
ncbi:MAG: hypothetical protein GY765_03955 [bacterium]|nr:hypothetical protein [bacterium]